MILLFLLLITKICYFQICEETDNLYTKAKESLVEAYGGLDNLPKDFTSIRPNFIEQLKKGLDMNEIEDEEEEEEPEPEPEITTQVTDYSDIFFCSRFF